MQTKQTSIAMFIGALALLALIGYFGVFLFERVTRQPSVEKIRIANAGQLSILNVVAQERGFFTANGLDAEVTENDSGVSAMDSLLKGEADVAVSAEFVGVRSMFVSDDLRMLSQVAARDRDVFRLVARRDAGIGSLADLKGKRIGVTPKSAGEFYLWRFLLFNGIGLDEVITVDLNATQLIERIDDARIDAAVAFEPNAYIMERGLGPNAIGWSAQGNTSAYGLAYTTRSFLERHPEAATRYLRALAQAERYVKEHPGESQEIVIRTLGLDEGYVRYVWDKLRPGLRLDQDLILAMEVQARWAIENGLTDRTEVPNYLDRIFFGALEGVNPGAIGIVH